MFDNLFNPLTFGTVILPNRICFLAHRTNFADRNRFNNRHIAYYQRRAAGGCGLIVVGELSIHPNDRPWETMIDAYRPEVVEDYQKLTDAVHKHDSRIFAQLCHHGFQSNGFITRQAVWGPSATSDIVFGETAKAMELEDMAVVVEAFSNAALLAKNGDFDGIEIDMGPESLLRQFLSPLSNLRQDDYGGSLENRMRLPLEVIKSIRKSVGNDFIVGIKLCADEMFWGGIALDESRQIAKQFESSEKVDFINVTIGTYYNLHLIMASMHTPSKFALEVTEQIKEAVTIPVIAAHQISFPHMADEIIEKGQASAIGFVRQLISDPDAPNKAKEGRFKDIRYCIRDNYGCIGRINQSKPLSCIQNPSVGFENSESKKKPRKYKQVMVVGGGPAGLEVARMAKERGHEVVLYEKAHEVGGQINMIKNRPGRQAMAGIIIHLLRELEKLQVPMVLGTEVTPALVHANKPDVVIVATGSKPRENPLPGDYVPPTVLNVWEAIEGKYPMGENVLFVDQNSGHHATATVELLADQGKKVNMVTGDLFVGIQLASIGDLYLTRQRLLQKGVIFTTDVIIDRIVDNNEVQARNIYTNKPVLFKGYDTIILDMGNMVDDYLYRQLKGNVPELYRVGDCVAPRGIDMAILEGRRMGEKL